jgi:hypothetical protein
MLESPSIGKAGHLAAMAELSLGGYNFATPEIDKGDDLFGVNDRSGAKCNSQRVSSDQSLISFTDQ